MNFCGPFTCKSNRLMLLGGGELGKEIVIEGQRLGCYTIVVDKYDNAPAMQVSHKKHIIDMKNYNKLKYLIEEENPTHIIPEIEAINIDCLKELERIGYNIIPSAKAVYITMHRQRLRDLANKLGIITTEYAFANDYDEYLSSVENIGLPCVVKPSMSSSGKGQSILKEEADIKNAWVFAQKNLRGNSKSVIVEKFLDFDYEVTLLTVNSVNGIHYCNPIKHKQKDGDFIYSSQPCKMTDYQLNTCKNIAKLLIKHMGGYGVFGMEFFIKGDEVYFNECSPRPHDTGYITLKTQNMSQFDLHVRAILGMKIPTIKQYTSGFSKAINYFNDKNEDIINPEISLNNNENDNISIYYFGKPYVKANSKRRVGLLISTHDDLEIAKQYLEKV